MKNFRFLIALGLTLGLGGNAFATHNPISSNQNRSTWAAGLQNIDVSFTNTNASGMKYLVMASNNGSLSTSQNPAIPADGSLAILEYAYFGTGGAEDVPISNIGPVQAEEPFFIYVQSCESSYTYTPGAVNSSLCSNWVLISGGSISTLSLSTNPGFTGVNAASVLSPSSLRLARNDSPPFISESFAQNWQIRITENGTANTSGDLGTPFNPTAPAGLSVTVDSTFFSNHGTAFRMTPNNDYVAAESIIYRFNQQTSAYTPPASPFWTNPVNPGPVTMIDRTHCSVDLEVQNAANGTAPANPAYSDYRLCVVGTSGSCLTKTTFGGTGVFGDVSAPYTFNNLLAGTAYTVTKQVMNEGGGSWNPTATLAAPEGAFSTLSWGTPTFGVNTITTNSANFTLLGLDQTGITSWRMRINNNPSTTNNVPPAIISPIPITGLNPNVQYTAQIELFEGSAACSSIMPQPGIAFTTTPNIPQTFALTAVNPRQLSASWATNGNPAGTVYRVEYCTDPGFLPASCRTQDSVAGASSIAAITMGVVPETTYFAHVLARTVGGGADSAYSNSDSDTTPNEAPTVSPVAVTLHTTSATLAGHATDFNDPGTALRFHWAITSQPLGSIAAFTVNDALGNASGNSTTQLTFNIPGTYSGTLTVTDHSGGLGGVPTTVNWTTNGTQVPTMITIAPAAATVVTAATQVFNATVCDQFETPGNCTPLSSHIISGQAVSWSVTGGGTIPAGNSASKTFTATTPGGPFTLTASLPGASNGTAQITVVAAGPQFTSGPTMTVNTSDYLTGTLMATGTDNVLGTTGLTYTWVKVSGPGSISVSPNGTTSSGNSTVTFSKAGDYVLSCTLNNANGSSGPSNTSPATVPQVVSSIGITPNNVTISLANIQQFSLQWRDQFGDVMPNGAVTWAATGGSVSGAGVFQSGSLGTNIRITATATQPNQLGQFKQGAATVNIVDYDVSAAKAYPVPFKSTLSSAITFTGLGSDAQIRIYTTSGRLVFSTHVTSGGDFPWAVVNSAGEKVASGVYLYVIESPTTTKHGKLIIIQ